MANFARIVLFFAVCAAAVAQAAPMTKGVLSSTRLLRIARLTPSIPEAGPDGLVFTFLVSRTGVAQHRLSVGESRALLISGKSYRESSQSVLGRVPPSRMAIHDAPKYAVDHPQFASAVAPAPPRSLIVTLEISGPELQAGDDVEVCLHVGFGRSAGKPEAEDLVFKAKVPRKRS